MCKRLFPFLAIVLFLFPLHGHGMDSQLTLIVKSSGNASFQSELSIYSEPMIEDILQAEPIEKVNVLPVSNEYLLLEDGTKVKIYIMDGIGNIFNIETKEKIHVPNATAVKLKTYFKGLHTKHFGTLTPWEQVDKLLPRYSKFEITDIETGYRFHVQRRAGQNHADVQPLTRKDTKIMKTIYNGKWSWNRRAILVHKDGKTIAASMHGMPHGGGAITNGFPGHFCIHFKDCVTHRTRSLDLSHQLMVHKAAGTLPSFIKTLHPEEIVQVFFIAVNHHDLELLQRICEEEIVDQSYLDDVELIRAVETNLQPTINGTVLYELPLTYKVKVKGSREAEKTFIFRLKRNSIITGWKLEGIPE